MKKKMMKRRLTRKHKDKIKAKMLEEFFKQFDEAADRVIAEERKQKPEMLKVRYVG